MNVKKAGDAFIAREKAPLLFIRHFSEQAPAAPQTASAQMSPEEKVTAAVLDGDRDRIVSLLEALQVDFPPPGSSMRC